MQAICGWASTCWTLSSCVKCRVGAMDIISSQGSAETGLHLQSHPCSPLKPLSIKFHALLVNFLIQQENFELLLSSLLAPYEKFELFIPRWLENRGIVALGSTDARHHVAHMRTGRHATAPQARPFSQPVLLRDVYIKSTVTVALTCMYLDLQKGPK